MFSGYNANGQQPPMKIVARATSHYSSIQTVHRPLHSPPLRRSCPLAPASAPAPAVPIPSKSDKSPDEPPPPRATGAASCCTGGAAADKIADRSLSHVPCKEDGGGALIAVPAAGAAGVPTGLGAFWSRRGGAIGADSSTPGGGLPKPIRSISATPPLPPPPP